MLKLYHHGTSVCAAKVRTVCAEKGLKWTGHYIDILKGEQFAPEYMALNPKAVVPTLVHGGAVKDLLASEDNPSREMVQQLLDYGVRFIVCGQSAAGQGIAQDDLIPGVEMALSAMTAHALLQQRGYTVNPF